MNFHVDAALLRELGERLIGRPHVALAELVKNAYDADAAVVRIQVGPEAIIVEDDGHGMTYEEFVRKWMRIGSRHKVDEQRSRAGRSLTGSKGVGRLAVQFLGASLRLTTTPLEEPDQSFEAAIDWTSSINNVKDLVEVKVDVRGIQIPDKDRNHGVRLEIRGLALEWDDKESARLARELWHLQPPFGGSRHSSFRVELVDSSGAPLSAFTDKMAAWYALWEARFKGRMVTQRGIPVVSGTLEWFDGESSNFEFPVQKPDGSTQIPNTSFEIRVFDLKGRQREGVRVSDFRDYLNEYGGVRIFDAQFNLPYYGLRAQDWLGVEQDHAHRITTSQVLPKELRHGGLNFLPTSSRLLGAVHIDTSEEQRRAGKSQSRVDTLAIQMSRDRLVENRAYRVLRDSVRAVIDLYAEEKARRRVVASEEDAPDEPVSAKLAQVEESLTDFEHVIPPVVFKQVRARVAAAVRASEAESASRAAHVGLLGGLATAGMLALAWEHESAKQLHLLDRLVKRIEAAESGPISAEIVLELKRWLNRARLSRAMFSPLLDERTRADRQTFRARKVVEQICEQVRLLAPDVRVDTTSVSGDLWLPSGTFAEWSAIFQNVILNSYNAVALSPDRRIAIGSRVSRGGASIVIQDSGVGVKIEGSESLFEPFVRRVNVDPHRRALGLGGTGLGLTIVRMVADSLGCKTRFAEPDPGFATCLEVSWKTK